MQMVEITVDRLAKSFVHDGGSKEVLRDINLRVRAGEVIAIRGDNGTGKTTLLNIVVGIEPLSAGTVHFSQVPNGRLRVGYVQQDYTSSLLPWFDVLDNVSIPLRLQGVASGERRSRADQLLDTMGFHMLPRNAYPHQLSGGQKQRVALARALVNEPHLLVLDEPFANLDAHTTRDLQETLCQIHHRKSPTVLYVSHDLDQFFLADRVLLLNGSPAGIAAEFEVALKRPRSREMILYKEYAAVRAKILAHEETLYGKRG